MYICRSFNIQHQPVNYVPRQPVVDTIPRQPVDTVPRIDYKGDVAASVIKYNISVIKRTKLHINHLTDGLFSRDIVSERDIDDIMSGQTYDEKMSRLLNVVRATIEGDGAIFGQLMEIFEQEGSRRGKKLADTLKNKYNEGKVYNKIMALNNCFLECLKLESSQSPQEGNFYNYLNIMTFDNRILQWSGQ